MPRVRSAVRVVPRRRDLIGRCTRRNDSEKEEHNQGKECCTATSRTGFSLSLFRCPSTKFRQAEACPTAPHSSRRLKPAPTLNCKCTNYPRPFPPRPAKNPHSPERFPRSPQNSNPSRRSLRRTRSRPPFLSRRPNGGALDQSDIRGRSDNHVNRANTKWPVAKPFRRRAARSPSD